MVITPSAEDNVSGTTWVGFNPFFWKKYCNRATPAHLGLYTVLATTLLTFKSRRITPWPAHLKVLATMFVAKIRRGGLATEPL